MDTLVSGRLQIDRLSSLPPELLLTIFDLSYDPDQLPLEPLSKRLLPYFRRNLYRQIRVSSLSSWSKLLSTVEESPSFGDWVHNLDVSKAFTYLKLGTFEDIVKPFPRLKSVKTGRLYSLPSSPPFTLAPLRNLSYRCTQLSNIDLSTVSHFPHLARLDIAFILIETSSPLPSAVVFTELEDLTLHRETEYLEDEPEWPLAVSTLISRCPNLTRLRLSDSSQPYYSALLPTLTHLFSRLKKLELATSDDLDGFYGPVCDLHLPRFVNLRYLDLADNTVGRSLIANLRKLPLLSTLRFGPMTFLDGPTSNDLLSLVDGPTRLPQLTRLVLDCVYATAGERWDMDKLEQAIVRSESTKMTGWEPPDFGERFGIDDLRKIVAAGGSNGIEIVGSSVEAIAVWDTYQVERANRRVMKAFKTKSLEGLKWMRQFLPVGLPDIDFDKLDPNNLQLVKIDLPEENWFRLSLE